MGNALSPRKRSGELRGRGGKKAKDGERARPDHWGDRQMVSIGNVGEMLKKRGDQSLRFLEHEFALLVACGFGGVGVSAK